MLTTQSATPDAVLEPFVHCYVQRVSKAGEVIEPVFPRMATMLIFQFAAIYEVKEYETEQRRRSWVATVVGPIAARRTRLICAIMWIRSMFCFGRWECTVCLACRFRRLLAGARKGMRYSARRYRLSISVSAMRRPLPIAYNCWTDFSFIGCSSPARSIRPLAPCTGWPLADAT